MTNNRGDRLHLLCAAGGSQMPLSTVESRTVPALYIPICIAVQDVQFQPHLI